MKQGFSKGDCPPLRLIWVRLRSMNPEFQVDFLRKLQRLLAEGDVTATYKFALLHAIADLCIENDADPDGRLTLTVDQLAAKFIDLYWRQVQEFPLFETDEPYRLRQTSGGTAVVVSALCDLQDTYAFKPKRPCPDSASWLKAHDRISSKLKEDPLWRLQIVGSETDEFIYEHKRDTEKIHLLPGISFCFRSFYGLIIELVRSAWVRRIRQLNKPIRKSLELHSFLFGTERSSLEDYRKVLRTIDEHKCFYCNKQLTRDDMLHVDHFIPWSRYPNDLGHNFVLADGSCNNSKSNYLAAEEHLEHWTKRNRDHGDKLSAEFTNHSLTHDLPASIRVAKWAYGELHQVGGDVWVAGKEMRRLSHRWATAV